MNKKPSIILAVTIADSVKLLGGLPAHLAKKGWEVHLVSGPGVRLEAYAGSSVHIHPIAMERKPSPLLDLQALLAWIRLIRKVNPDAVSAGTPKASLLGLIAARLTGVRVRIYTLRGLRLETLKGIPRVVQGLAELVTASLATHVIAVSESLKSKYLELGLTSSKKIRVLGPGSSHGVNTQRFRPLSRSKREALRRELRLEKGVPVLGFVGRFSEDKGATLLLETRTELLANGIDHEYLFIGYVEDSHEILKAINRQGRDVKFLEDLEDVSPYYGVMDLLLLPSKREGFPNVILEAAASGVPAVTTYATGSVDAVVNGMTGVMCSDEKIFPLAVSYLCKSLHTRVFMGANARERARAVFEEIHVLNLNSEAYSSLLRSKGEELCKDIRKSVKRKQDRFG